MRILKISFAIYAVYYNNEVRVKVKNVKQYSNEHQPPFITYSDEGLGFINVYTIDKIKFNNKIMKIAKLTQKFDASYYKEHKQTIHTNIINELCHNFEKEIHENVEVFV